MNFAFQYNPRQNQILEYLLQLYAIVREDPNATIYEQREVADAVVSYAHSTQGYEYARVSKLAARIVKALRNYEKKLPIDAVYSQTIYLPDKTAIAQQSEGLTSLPDLGKTSRGRDKKTAVNQIVDSLRVLAEIRLSELGPSESGTKLKYPTGILKIPQLFLRKKRELYKFPGPAQSSEPLYTYNVKPQEEFTWTITEKFRKFSESVDTSSVIDSVTTESQKSFENELKNTDSTRSVTDSENNAYLDTQTSVEWGVEANVSAGSAVTPVQADVSADYRQTSDVQTKNELKNRASKDAFTEAVSTAISRQTEKCNTSRTTAAEKRVTVQTEQQHEDTKIRKIFNNNRDREWRVEFFQTVVPWTTYIVLSNMDLVLTNGIVLHKLQFSDTYQLLKLLEDPVVQPENTSIYELLIESLSELELIDFEQNVIKPFKIVGSTEYYGKSYPRLQMNLPERNVAKSDESQAVNFIQGLILSKKIYFMRTENVFEKTKLLDEELLSDREIGGLETQLKILAQDYEQAKAETEKRVQEMKIIDFLFANFHQMDRSVQISAILSTLSKNSGNLFENITLLMNLDKDRERNHLSFLPPPK